MTKTISITITDRTWKYIDEYREDEEFDSFEEAAFDLLLYGIQELSCAELLLEDWECRDKLDPISIPHMTELDETRQKIRAKFYKKEAEK